MSFNGDLNASDDGLELTTKGQIHTYSTENSALNVGSNSYILSANSTASDGIEWVANTDAGLTLGSKGDIHTRSASDQAALAVGANLKTIYANSAETTGLEWNTNARETLTAAGDILYASGANTLAKLAKGSDTDVLTLASGLPSWAAAAGGGTWSTLTTAKLSSSNAVMDSGSFTAKEFLLIQCRLKATSASTTSLRYKFNNVVTSTYNYTYSLNGLNGNSSLSQIEINPLGVDGVASGEFFINVFVYNVATENKTAISHGMTKTSVMNSSIGSALWAETTNPITSVQFFNETGGHPSGEWDIGSEVVVLGYDS